MKIFLIILGVLQLFGLGVFFWAIKEAHEVNQDLDIYDL